MGFRDLFNKMAGARAREDVQSTSIPEQTDKTVGTASTDTSAHETSPGKQAADSRATVSPSTESDPMKLAQMRLAAKRNSKILVRGISKYGRNGYGGVFSPGGTVSLERDPSNSYDPNAVKVLLSDGSMLGFVAREMAGPISSKLAEGWKYKVRIAEGPYVDDKWGQCSLEIVDINSPEKTQSGTVLPNERESSKMPAYGYIPPLDFGDEWRYGKSEVVAVSELKWLYAYYFPVKSAENFVIRECSAAAVLADESRAANEDDANGRHMQRALLAAYSIKGNAAADEYLRLTGKLKGMCAANCLDKLLPAISDCRIKDFIACCIDMDSVNEFADHCWNVNRAVLDKKDDLLRELSGLGMVPRLGSYMTLTGLHTDFNIMYTSELISPLSKAVERNDVAEARYLISYGADVNQMMFNSGGRGKDAWRLYSKPVLTMVRSLDMYRLFVGARALPYPKSYTYHGNEKSDGEEHNLLDALWQGPKMDDAATELADYLVFTEYDMPLRAKIDEIRKSCERTDGCPYKNNVAYVLEWCDMEKRAIAAATARWQEIAKRDGHTHHSLSWDLGLFIGEWKTDGYDQSLRWHEGEFSKEDTPPRYAYPERIVMRGFRHGVS